MNEITAMEVFGTPYMTRDKEMPIQERGYWSALYGKNLTTEGLRGASAEEYEEWKKEKEKLNPFKIKRYGEN